ncbi:zinc ribbon domain-containing protein [Acutalibacter muris]|uniref:Zinc ribbon domain-containing protein n=1 Tax=Acutalibacter muris TaxID=1796620 RepID=A0AA92QX40_9FIRM|nr:zinc ribbon domain-containing protein [Acutalibacter muris]QQR30712.1 zinc ribbon domain-containing protein [Acutalibacter muris]
MAKFCGNCGKPLGENDEVCGNCGTHVAVNEAVPPTAQSRTASNAINGKKAAVIGGALLAVIVLAVVLIKVASGTTPGPSTSSTSSAPSSSTAQQIAANSSTPDGEPTPIPAAKNETLEGRAKKAIKELDVWDGSVAESFDGGDGSVENPYQIANGGQLAKLAQDTNSGIDFAGFYFVLTSDIMLNDINGWDFGKTPEANTRDASNTSPIWKNTWESIGERSYSWDQDGNAEAELVKAPFAGNFDGAGYTVWGMFCPMGSTGLFGFVTGNITNTSVACGSIWNYSVSAGAVVAWLQDNTISNCYSEDIFIQSDTGKLGVQELVGSICGFCEDNCNVLSCSAKNVEIHVMHALRSEIGGILGGSFSGDCNISNCYSECDIDIYGVASDTVTYNRAGGICGTGKNISNCISNTNISFFEVINDDNRAINSVAGGIAGSCSGNIVSCGSNGDISGICNNNDRISFGGIAFSVGRGENDTGNITIRNCYTSGKISVEDGEKSEDVEVNGLICNILTDGNNEIEASVTDCYFVTSGSDQAIGSNAKEISLFTNQVISVSSKSDLNKFDTFMNWDFENEWAIDNKVNDGFPIPRSLFEILS